MLLDLAFFPTPLAKSTYSPVSGLKVVRRPSGFHKSDDDDDDNDGAMDSASPHAQPYRAGPTTMTTPTMSGPSPMPAPKLLEAINRNALAVFLLVCLFPLRLVMVKMYGFVSHDRLMWRRAR